MRRLLVLTAMLLLIATAGGCVATIADTVPGQDNSALFDYILIESPLTGRCYEVVERFAGSAGLMGMAEIPCEDAEEGE